MVTESPNATLLDAMETARREEIEREARRRELMATIARHRWQIAKHHHRLETGEALDFGKYPYQPAIYQDDALELVVLGSVQWGKSLPNDARVHTPQGWRRNGDLRVGDRVSTPFGVDASITGVFPQGKVPIYRITFEDGRSVEACGEHLWEVWQKGKAQILTTRQIQNTLGEQPCSVILTQPAEQPMQDLPLDPYLLGLLLGDGGLTKRQISFTKPDQQLVEAIRSLLPRGVELVHYASDKDCGYRVRSEGGKCSHYNPLADALESLGLLGTTCFTKFVPEIYKNGSVEQRLALLQGLMDTDGSGGEERHLRLFQ